MRMRTTNVTRRVFSRIDDRENTNNNKGKKRTSVLPTFGKPLTRRFLRFLERLECHRAS